MSGRRGMLATGRAGGGLPGGEWAVDNQHLGEDRASTHRGQRSAEGRMGLSVAAVGQISLPWPSARADFSQALALDPSLSAAQTSLDALKEDEE